MDLASLDTASTADQGAALELRHPATNAVLTKPDGSAITITLAGTDSERHRRAARAATNRRLKNSTGRRQNTLTAEEIEGDGIDLLVASTIGWDGVMVDGQPLAYTPDNARKLYKRFSWVTEQAEAFVAERGNFLKASPTI